MDANGAFYGGGKAGGTFDPIAFVMRPIVILRAVCWVGNCWVIFHQIHLFPSSSRIEKNRFLLSHCVIIWCHTLQKKGERNLLIRFSSDSNIYVEKKKITIENDYLDLGFQGKYKKKICSVEYLFIFSW
jgi:hypothetical protein